MRTQSTVAVRAARTNDAEQIASLYHAVYGEHYSHKEYLDSTFVCHAIKEGFVWYVGESDGKIVGSAVGVPCAWNRSIEIGRTVVERAFQRQGLAKSLGARVCQSAMDAGHDLAWGTIRSYPVYRMSQRDGMVCVGYLPGRHKAENRECHLLGMRLSPHAKRSRIAATESWANDLSGAKDLVAQMGLSGRQGGYPARTIVGTPPCKGITLGFNFHFADQSLTLTDLSTLDIGVPEYLEATVLADKTAALRLLYRFGFRVCAFLPGWYADGGERYDCFLLANVCVEEAPAPAGLEEVVASFRDSFEAEKR